MYANYTRKAKAERKSENIVIKDQIVYLIFIAYLFYSFKG